MNISYSHIAYTKTILHNFPVLLGTHWLLLLALCIWNFSVSMLHTNIGYFIHFWAFDTNDKVNSNLLKYQSNTSGTTWIDTTTYTSTSDLSKLTHVCVTNNGSDIFIIGGYDSVSNSPYHNIQMYDISTYYTTCRLCS